MVYVLHHTELRDPGSVCVGLPGHLQHLQQLVHELAKIGADAVMQCVRLHARKSRCQTELQCQRRDPAQCLHQCSGDDVDVARFSKVLDHFRLQP